MGRINWARVITGGLVAGLIINIFEFAVNGMWLMKDWADAMTALGKPSAMSTGMLVVLNAWGFLTGISALWLYAAIRPRFAPGPGTAIIAAFGIWFVGYFLGSLTGMAFGIFPTRLMIIGLAVGIVEVVAGTLVGARMYQEAETSMTKAAGAR